MRPKLLLADDSVTIQRVIELTFADEDVQVVAVGDGQQAIDRVRTDHPDIVLADVGMPELDGYEVSAFIKGDPALAHIPVLLLTGAFEPIDEARARAVGCDGVLVKPFEPQMVISRVRDLLAGKREAAFESEVLARRSGAGAGRRSSRVLRIARRLLRQARRRPGQQGCARADVRPGACREARAEHDSETDLDRRAIGRRRQAITACQSGPDRMESVRLGRAG